MKTVFVVEAFERAGLEFIPENGGASGCAQRVFASHITAVSARCTFIVQAS
jgi:hypothetical protein